MQMGTFAVTLHQYYFSSILMVGMLPWSKEVTIHTDWDFCYPGTECWTEIPNRKYRAWTGICVHGANQSPIDLPKETEPSASVAIKLDINSYRHKRFHIENNGHTLKITPVIKKLPPGTTEEMVKMKEKWEGKSRNRTGYRNNNKVTYVFAQAHFHWGQNNSFGSEHTIEGRRFSLEMHLVHFMSKYKSIGEAAASNDPSALTVIATLFQASDDFPDNPLFTIINNNFPLKYDEEEAKEIHLNLHDFLPKRGSTYYRYQGSLTTPDCEEIVQWNVFDQPNLISNTDMEKFRNATDKHDHLLGLNYRQIQHGNLRTIYYLKLL